MRLVTSGGGVSHYDRGHLDRTSEHGDSAPPGRASSYPSDAAASSTRIGFVRSSASSVRSSVSAGSAPLPTPVPADAHAARNQAWRASSQQGSQSDAINSHPPSVVRTYGQFRPESSVESWVHVPSQFDTQNQFESPLPTRALSSDGTFFERTEAVCSRKIFCVHKIRCIRKILDLHILDPSHHHQNTINPR
ncbi:hypothetical protein C8J57DRAFT_1705828 [Mycena rebaudengoi]|nr:hypothetical protein C8J57DRAFT_1705828 [Mycena rebaudengoi]